MKYFVYSRAQHKEQDKIANNINRKYIPGKVLTGGIFKLYTEILSIPQSRYSDAIIVVSTPDDTLESVNYIEPNYVLR